MLATLQGWFVIIVKPCISDPDPNMKSIRCHDLRKV